MIPLDIVSVINLCRLSSKFHLQCVHCDNRIPFKYFSFKQNTMLSFFSREHWRSIRKKVFTHTFPGAARCVSGVAVSCATATGSERMDPETLQSHPGLRATSPCPSAKIPALQHLLLARGFPLLATV